MRAHACVLLLHAAYQAYKLQQLLAVGSVVLHPASTWRAYFYGALLPYVHYVPLWRAAEEPHRERKVVDHAAEIVLCVGA